MKRCLCALAAVLALGLAGCGILEPSAAAEGATGGQAAAESPSPLPTTPARSGFGSLTETGDLPNPCTLLTEAEVVELTGREVAQVDEDGAAPTDSTRYCQWQQTGGQLAVFLSRTTADDFHLQAADATQVDGVGDEAFSQAGHLYVRNGTLQLDIYSHGGTEEENTAEAKRVAEKLIPRV